MKTSRLSILAIASLLALTGCGGKKPTSSGDSGSGSGSSSGSTVEEGPFVKEATEITIWTTYNDTYQTIINNAIDEFKTIEPNVTINNVKQTGSYDDLKKMVVDGFAVDNYPDMVAAYPDSVADFINNAKALNIEPYMLNENYGWTKKDLADIPEAYITAGQQYSIEGTYSLPASKSTEAMYYNQDVLIGLDLSGIDNTINEGKPLNEKYFKNLTWEEMFEHLIPALDKYDTTVKKIIDRETYSDWAWVGYDSDDNFFITLAEQYGYGYTSVNKTTGKGVLEFDNDGMKALMKKFKGYYDKHYFTTKGVIGQNVNYRSTKDAMLFSIGSTGGVKYQFDSGNAHNVGVVQIPHAEGGKTKIISQGPDFAFLNHNNDNRAKAIWLFYKLFTGTKYNTAWSVNTGYSPVRYSVMESAEYLAYSDDSDKEDKSLERLYALNAKYASSVSNYLFTSAVFKGSSEARKQVGGIFNACVVADNLDASIDKIFADAISNTQLKM